MSHKNSENNYRALDAQTVLGYLAQHAAIAARLGGDAAAWSASEVGDGNLNLVFIVTGTAGSVVVKQALPYVRMVGESWPLPLYRAHFEHLALLEQTRYAPQYVPQVYAHDSAMALTVMEYLSPHIILRKGLIAGNRYDHMAAHLGEFLARTLFQTSDLALTSEQKRETMAPYLHNHAMCQISEALIFDEPYFPAPMNRHTSPQLDELAAAFRRDTAAKLAAQEMKWKFQNAPEALLHGDLHTGSVMVTATDTKVIDPEFAFYGPMGFDVGAVVANLLLAYFAAPAHGRDANYQSWLLQQIDALWQNFVQHFTAQWHARTAAAPGGDIYAPRIMTDSPALMTDGLNTRLMAIWQDTIGFAACKMIRRILGLAHVEDLESIPDPAVRAACETNALKLARDMLVNRYRYLQPTTIAELAQNSPLPLEGEGRKSLVSEASLGFAGRGG